MCAIDGSYYRIEACRLRLDLSIISILMNLLYYFANITCAACVVRNSLEALFFSAQVFCFSFQFIFLSRFFWSLALSQNSTNKKKRWIVRISNKNGCYLLERKKATQQWVWARCAHAHFLNRQISYASFSLSRRLLLLHLAPFVVPNRTRKYVRWIFVAYMNWQRVIWRFHITFSLLYTIWRSQNIFALPVCAISKHNHFNDDRCYVFIIIIT